MNVWLLNEFKTAFRYIPRLLISAAIFALVIVSLLYGGAAFYGERTAKIPVGMALSEDKNENYLIRRVFESIELNDSSIEVTYGSEKQIRSQFDNGELAAAIYMSDNFLADLTSGKNTRARFVVGGDSLSDKLLVAAARAGAQLLKTSQSGISAVLGAAAEAGVSGQEYGALSDAVNMDYITLALAQNSMFDFVDLNGKTKLGAQWYVLLSGTLLCAAMTGIALCALMPPLSADFQKCLFRKRVPYWWTVGCRVIVLFAVTVLFSLAAAAALSALLSVSLNAEIFFNLIPAVLVLVMTQVFLLYVVPSRTACVLAQFAACIGMLYICGAVLPAELLPLSFQAFAPYLPLYAAVSQAESAIARVEGDFLPIIFWCAMFYALSVLAVKRSAERT